MVGEHEVWTFELIELENSTLISEEIYQRKRMVTMVSEGSYTSHEINQIVIKLVAVGSVPSINRIYVKMKPLF